MLERARQLGGVVAPPSPLPASDSALRVGDTQKPVLIEPFVAQPAVEALDQGILNRVARPDELQVDAARAGPGTQGAALKLRVPASCSSTATMRTLPRLTSTAIAAQSCV